MQIRFTTFRIIFALCAPSVMTACLNTAPAVPPSQNTTAIDLTADKPTDAPLGTCWGKNITPAIIETQTDKVLISPADISASGTIRKPAEYRTETTQTIVQPRQIEWFELICPSELTPEFTSTLQRALSARGHHEGPISGSLDIQTKDAIARFQTAQNLPGYELTKEAAQRLGLVAADNF
ncbi:MAG: peptidoglycan-binding domain-containing protein [Roseobacter sp.]